MYPALFRYYDRVWNKTLEYKVLQSWKGRQHHRHNINAMIACTAAGTCTCTQLKDLQIWSSLDLPEAICH